MESGDELLALKEDVEKRVRKKLGEIERARAVALDELEREFEERTKEKLETLEDRFSHELATLERTLISSALSKHNDAVNEKKNELVARFQEQLPATVQGFLESNYDAYLSAIAREIKEVAVKLGRPCKLWLNERDRKNLQLTWNSDEGSVSVKLAPGVLESTAGFKLETEDGQIVADYTLERKLEQLRPRLETAFGKAFASVVKEVMR
ncbi:MAG: hypothetical protein Kow0069_30850 [Promethearchaeota archaeon]